MSSYGETSSLIISESTIKMQPLEPDWNQTYINNNCGCGK